MLTRKSLLEALQHLAQRNETGCLGVRRGAFSATIYLQDGDVIDVDLHGRKDAAALLDLLGWESPTFNWAKGVSPYKASLQISIRELEAEWAARPHAVSAGASAVVQVANADREEGVALPELERYDISFNATDPSWRPSRYELRHPLKPSYVIGSAEHCDIRIDHYSVRRMHCGVMLEQGLIRIWDLGSHNATHVNDRLVDEAILKSGDALRVGDIELKLVFRLRRPELSAEPAVRAPAPPPESGTAPLPLRYDTIRKKRPGNAPGLLKRVFGGKPTKRKVGGGKHQT